MSDNGAMTKLYLFVLVLNLVFPVLSYPFTAFGEETENYETSLNPDSLMRIGLNLVDGESHNYKINYDSKRSADINKIGIKIIRYTNDDIIKNLDGVYEDLKKQIKIREKEIE